MSHHHHHHHHQQQHHRHTCIRRTNATAASILSISSLVGVEVGVPVVEVGVVGVAPAAAPGRGNQKGV